MPAVHIAGKCPRAQHSPIAHTASDIVRWHEVVTEALFGSYRPLCDL